MQSERDYFSRRYWIEVIPITKVTNKHLLPVGRYPMIYHAVYKLKQCEITDIMIITGKEHMGDVVSF